MVDADATSYVLASQCLIEQGLTDESGTIQPYGSNVPVYIA